MLSNKNMTVKYATIKNKKVVISDANRNKCLNVREQMGMVRKNKDGPFPSPTFLQIISICERKTKQKKMDTTVKFLHPTSYMCTFKKREKHPWRSVTFSKVEACNFTKSNTPPWVFFTFF